MASILSFARRRSASAALPSKMPWQNQDLAELYRVRDRLTAAGLHVEVDNGVSDEGDPWFIYQQVGTDNIVVHIARIDTELHVINCVTGNAYVGTSFRDVCNRMLEDASLALGSQMPRSSNVIIHPSAFLTAFVAAAIMLVDLIEHNRAEAAESQLGDGHVGGTPASHHTLCPQPERGTQAQMCDNHVANYSPEVDTVAEDGGPLARRLQKDGPANSVNGPAASTLASLGHAGFLTDGSGIALSLSAHFFAVEFLSVIAQDAEAGRVTDQALSEINDPSLAGESTGQAVSASTIAAPGHAKYVASQIATGATGAADIEIDLPGIDASLTAQPREEVPDTVEAVTSTAERTFLQTDPVARSSWTAPTTDSNPTDDAVAVEIETRHGMEPPVSAATGPGQVSAPVVQAASGGGIAAEAGNALPQHYDSSPSPPIDAVQEAEDDLQGNHDGSGTAAVTDGSDLIDSLVAGRAEVVYFVAGTTMVVEGFVLNEDLLTFADDDIGSAMTSNARRDELDLIMGDSEVGTIRLIGVFADTSDVLSTPSAPVVG